MSGFFAIDQMKLLPLSVDEQLVEKHLVCLVVEAIENITFRGEQ